MENQDQVPLQTQLTIPQVPISPALPLSPEPIHKRKNWKIAGMILMSVVVIFSLLTWYGFYLEKQDYNLTKNNMENNSQSQTTNSLSFLETPEYKFYYPSSFQAYDFTSEPGIVYNYGNGKGESINLVAYDYMNGKNLESNTCSLLLETFKTSPLKEQLNAYLVGEEKYSTDSSQKTCHYHYRADFPNKPTLNVEYMVFQGKTLNANFAITIVYSGNYPDISLLQNAQRKFIVQP